jgi:Reverse transcriptase (RNA-dependent DNA polymerase)
LHPQIHLLSSTAIIKELEGCYGFQLKGTGPTTFHLGCDVGLEGHTLVIVKALYGLKSSRACWWEVLADVLRQVGFTPSKADNNIWMCRVGDLYEYMVIYVDNLGIASSDPSAIIKELEGRYGFQFPTQGYWAHYFPSRMQLFSRW